jgi:citrate synthase
VSKEENMIDEAKLKVAVLRGLNLPEDKYRPDLELGQVAQWDSLGHLGLIFAVEDQFGVKFESEKIPRLKTLAQIRSALAECLKT